MARVLIFIAAFWIWAGASLAQQIEFDRFDRFADSVAQSLDSGQLSDTGLESLRESLSAWRETFLAGQDVNATRIEALQAQLDSLGPAPAEGETEAEDVATRRQELRAALDEARAPQLDAAEAYARADALIGRIDTTLRERQADALLELERTPLDPTLWPGAAAALAQVLQDVRKEVTASLSREMERSEVPQRIAIAVLLLGAALLLLIRGPNWIERYLSRIESGAGLHGSIVYGFLVSFASVMVAMAGVSLINAALISTGLLGRTGQALAIGINAAILAYAVGRWLGGRSFPVREHIPSVLVLDARRRAAARRQATSLSILTGLLILQGILDEAVRFDPATLSVVTLPVHVLLGLVLFRLGGLMRLGGQSDGGEAGAFTGRVIRLLGLAVQAVAIVAPVLAAIGFFNLARGVLLPLSLSLALLSFLMALHFAIRAGYALVRGLDVETAQQALVPVLISLGVSVASLPVFALFWGARNSDLGEVWSHFKAGIQIGDATISPGAVLTFAIVFAIGFGLTRLIQGTLRSSVLPRTAIDKGGQNAIVSGLGYVGITIAALVGITSAGLNLSSFAIVIGALGVGIGFGLQNIVNNFVSGIILLIERPISEGDWVEVGGQMGIVKAISVRSTRIETFDRTDVIVPNGDLISGTVTNWTRGNSIGRVIVPVGVAYGTDTRKVEAVLREIADNHPLVAVEPEPYIYFKGFGADSMDFEIRAILTDINFGLSVKTDMNHEIARRFAEEGIEIPFAQRDIWLRNPEALVRGTSAMRAPSSADPALGRPGEAQEPD